MTPNFVCLARSASSACQNHLVVGRSSLGDVRAQNVQLTGAPADSFLEHSVLDSGMRARLDREVNENATFEELVSAPANRVSFAAAAS
jgi:hypothetical protein